MYRTRLLLMIILLSTGSIYAVDPIPQSKHVTYESFGAVGDGVTDDLPAICQAHAHANHCKNILLEDCVLSRMDTHQGVSGTYTIRRSTLGHAGLNAIGRGLLSVEDSTLHGNSLISFRSDYGSTWEGDVIIRNSRWVPGGGRRTWPNLLQVTNDGTHDFGYPCFMPETVTIDSLIVDDSNAPNNYTGMYLFSNPDSQANNPGSPRPFPYEPTKRVQIRRLETASGKTPQISSNADLQNNIIVEK